MPKDILRRIVLPVAAEIFNNSNFQKYNQTFFLRKIPANSKSECGTDKIIVISHPGADYSISLEALKNQKVYTGDREIDVLDVSLYRIVWKDGKFKDIPKNGAILHRGVLKSQGLASHVMAYYLPKDCRYPGVRKNQHIGLDNQKSPLLEYMREDYYCSYCSGKGLFFIWVKTIDFIRKSGHCLIVVEFLKIRVAMISKKS